MWCYYLDFVRRRGVVHSLSSRAGEGNATYRYDIQHRSQKY